MQARVPRRGQKMGTLPLDDDFIESNIFLTLGLKELGKYGKHAGSPKILPLLSLLLEKSIQKSEKTQKESMQSKDAVTIFHALKAPTISIQQYINRIFKYSGCSPSCFVIAYIYVDRFLGKTDALLTSRNVHRLLITSVMVAAKLTDDAFYNNAYYARVGGISTSDLNNMEMKLLFSLDFRLQVSLGTFQRYCFELQREGTEGLEIERPVKACRFIESRSNKGDAACATTVQM